MASRNATVAEAVKAALNTAAADPDTFGESFVAKRLYAPTVPLEETKDLVVTVYAPGDSKSNAARLVRAYEIPVLVALQKRFTQAADPSLESANDECDSLMELAEKVFDFFDADAAGVGGAKWIGSDLSLGHPDIMREQRQFMAVATFRFLMHVTR